MQRTLAGLAVLIVALTARRPSSPRSRRRAASTNLAALALPRLLPRPSDRHRRHGRRRRGPDRGWRTTTRSIHLLFKGTAPDGLDEVRGEFWDIGRMKPDDIRALRPTTCARRSTSIPTGRGRAPARSPRSSPPPSRRRRRRPRPSIRAIVLHPSRYLDQKVTVTGQFGGTNLLGDLPDAPGKSRYDFVLRSADAAIWVQHAAAAEGRERQGLRAWHWTRGSTPAAGSTCAGTVKTGRGLLVARRRSRRPSARQAADRNAAADDEPIRVPAGPPPEVIFSAPTQDETDVSMSTTVRIQFSRDIDPVDARRATCASRYLESQTAERGEPTTPTARVHVAVHAARTACSS